MIKNINDLLSLAALIVIVIMALKYLFGTFVIIEVKSVKHEEKSKLKLIKDYLDNIDE